jgi:ubiquinone/menaquinone biosynthesis C-methylase UbiE
MDPMPTATAPAKMQVEALFDSLALEYVRSRDGQLSFQCQKRIALEFLGDARGRLLEVGCGPAVMMPDLLAMGFEVQGIDVSGEMVRRGRQSMAGHPLRERCRLDLGDVERLQFPDASFDAVLCMGVLEYLPGSAAALAELGRVLRPGGVAVFSMPNGISAYHVARNLYGGLRDVARRVRRKPAPADEIRYNRCIPFRFGSELAASGMESLEHRSCNFIFFPLHELSPRLSESVNRAMLPLGDSVAGPLLGAQYLVKARKTVCRSA